jgi:hypothetical protein
MDDPNWLQPRILDGLSTLWIMDLKAGCASGKPEKLRWHEALCLLNMDTSMTELRYVGF